MDGTRRALTAGVRLGSKRRRLWQRRMEEPRQGLRQEHTCTLQLYDKSNEGDFPFEWGGTIGRFPRRLERELRWCIRGHREDQRHTITVISELLSTQRVLQLHHRRAKRRHYRRVHRFPTWARWVTTDDRLCTRNPKSVRTIVTRDNAKRIHRLCSLHCHCSKVE